MSQIDYVFSKVLTSSLSSGLISMRVGLRLIMTPSDRLGPGRCPKALSHDESGNHAQLHARPGGQVRLRVAGQWRVYTAYLLPLCNSKPRC